MSEQEIPKLEAHVQSLQVLLIRAYSQFLFYRPAMLDVNLIARMGIERRRAGFEKLRTLLYWGFIQELVKICDDGDKRTPSISRICKKLEDPNVLRVLEEKFSNAALPRAKGESYENWRRLFEEREQELRERFKQVHARMKLNAGKLFASPALEGYKTIRNKLIAHNELRLTDGKYEFFDITILKLKFGQERVLLEQAKAVFDDLNSLVRNASFLWDSFFRFESRDVCQFWGIDKIEEALGEHPESAPNPL